ncbi:MAG: hypothetical protein EXR53_03655 [Dehalococcoidia bacterium]|nr:hypothetical protein [Dehalococcoidia bacterium]
MLAEPLFFEDLEVGQSIGPNVVVITTEQVRAFMGYRFRRGPPMGRFLDDSAAQEEGLPAAVLPAQFIIALISKFVTDWSPSVTLNKLDVVFRQWVLHNTPVHFQGIVTGKNLLDAQGQVECDVFVQKPSGERLVFSKAVVELPVRGR